MKNILSAFLILSALFSVSLRAGPMEDLAEFANHLGFLGYTVSQESEKILLAEHASNPNLHLESYQGGVLFTATYATNDNGKSHRAEVLELINELNSDAVAARYYLNKNGVMVIEGYYPGRYDKASFALFIEKYNLLAFQMFSQHLDALKKYFD